jgi:DNA-binding NarL/FixJ family response regulator
MRIAALTLRQEMILKRIADGLMDKQIAADLGLSEKTIEFHKRALKSRTGCESSAALTRYAIRAGLCRP